MLVTVVTMHRYDAELFTQVIHGNLTDEQREEWRKAHGCDRYHCEECDNDEGYPCDDGQNMFFRTLTVQSDPSPMKMLNADDEL